MLKIFKYLKESKWSVLAIIALLVVQAYCDLALPQYTADIVDVGIGQKGIENAVPERLRAETYSGLMAFMTQEERDLMASAYGQAEDGSYVFQGDKETEERINECIGIPIPILSAVRESADAMLGLEIDAGEPEMSGAAESESDSPWGEAGNLPEDLSSSILVQTDDQVLARRAQVLEGLGETGRPSSPSGQCCSSRRNTKAWGWTWARSSEATSTGPAA